MNGVLPAAAAVIALVFAVLLVRQHHARRKPYQAVWATAMFMYAVASGALAAGALGGWSPAEYRIYWLFGAVLNVPYLAQGEIFLLARRKRIAPAFAAVLAIATVFAAVSVFSAVINTAELAKTLPTGKSVWGPGSFALHLAQFYAYPTYGYLLAGTAYSAWKMRGARALRDRFLGTLAIAAGATVVAAGSAFAATGLIAGFSITLTAGIAVMFWGFLRASRPASTPPAVAAG